MPVDEEPYSLIISELRMLWRDEVRPETSFGEALDDLRRAAPMRGVYVQEHNASGKRLAAWFFDGESLNPIDGPVELDPPGEQRWSPTPKLSFHCLSEDVVVIAWFAGPQVAGGGRFKISDEFGRRTLAEQTANGTLKRRAAVS